MTYRSIHYHYDQLTEAERLSVDLAVSAALNVLRAERVPYVGDDRVERFVDALARCVISCRPPEPPERRYALLSPQGTACSETVLTALEYADPQVRAKVERDSCLGLPDDPVPGTWTDVTDNEACR